MRAPFQVLVLPYRWQEGKPSYAILQVVDGAYWQFVAGGGEDQETPWEAAQREAREETGLEGALLPLDSLATIPKFHFLSAPTWPEDIYVIPEHAFGMEVLSAEIQLSREHLAYRWVGFEEGWQLLKWDSNRNALWELDQRLKIED